MHGSIPFLSSYGHLSSSCMPNYAALSSLLHEPLSYYIHLSLSTENTAWSVRQVSTYLIQQHLWYFFLNLNLLDSP